MSVNRTSPLSPEGTGIDARHLQPVPNPNSRTLLVADAIRAAILDGELPTGAPLVERDLAARLGVSKTPVREALWSLRLSGLVVPGPGKGMTVRVIDDQFVREVYGVRLLMEPAAVAMSVAHQDEANLLEAAAALATSSAAMEHDDWSTVSLSNRRFHRSLYGRCGNGQLCDILDGLQDKLSLVASEGWRRRPTWHSEAREHAELLAAVRRGDAEEVRSLVSDHIRGASSRLVGTFDGDARASA